jgi:enoyl-CoA hydratase
MENLTFDVQDGVGIITLNRPRALNALNRRLVDELAGLLADIAGDALRALIVTGAGQRAFAAGADITEMNEMTATQAKDFSARGQAAFQALESFPCPTIAAVNGFALGGGCELAMSCDLILASPTAVFGQPEVKLGVIPGFGGTQRLTQRVGRQRALELMWTGRNIKAVEALSIGLTLRTVEEEPVLDAALSLAKRIAQNGPLAVQMVKRAVHDVNAKTAETGQVFEQSLFGQCFDTQDQTEGMQAFLEKRPAVFYGK